MRNRLVRLRAGMVAAMMVSAIAGVGATEPDPTPSNVAHVAVTIRAQNPGAYPVVTPEDVMVYEDSQRRPVVSWVPAKSLPGEMALTVLVDDSLLPNVGVQFKELANFFSTLPAGTRVRIAYASFGGYRVAQDFTTNPSLAAKGLRVPVGSAAIGGSIYQSVGSLLKKWPRDNSRRELLVISDGIDVNEGMEESAPDQNTELERAIKLAQDADVPIYTIFYLGSAQLESNELLLDNGQGCLLRLTAQTGGQSYFQGTESPLDFAPYLKQFADDLGHQYMLTFQPLPDARKGYQPLRVTTEVPGVHLVVPPRIFVSKDGR